MTQSNWQVEQQNFDARLASMDSSASTTLVDPKGLCLLAHAEFAAAESVYEPAPFVMINLCTAHVGQMKRSGDGPSLEGIIRPGTVAMSLPNTAASGYWSKTRQLGLAINPEALPEQQQELFSSDILVPAASSLHQDPLLSSVMTAMWRDAEANGLSSAFFEQGIYLLLNHLADYRHTVPKQPALTYALNGPRLQRVLDLIESRLTDNVSVAELAREARQDVRSFTRSFQAATGYAPYAYFTFRRMELAKRLLTNPLTSITEVAQTVGYANPSKFSAAFKRTYAITPGQWRRGCN